MPVGASKLARTAKVPFVYHFLSTALFESVAAEECLSNIFMTKPSQKKYARNEKHVRENNYPLHPTFMK